MFLTKAYARPIEFSQTQVASSMLSVLSCCLKTRGREKKWKEIEEGGLAVVSQQLQRLMWSFLDTPKDPGKSLSLVAAQNSLMMQGFEWHVPADQCHWQRLRKALPSLKDAGVDNLWIPPGCKGMDPLGTGYDLYDLYDLGEFHQKGSRATRWGPKEDLLELVHAARDLGINIYWDTVLNHKAGADFTEEFSVVTVNPESMSARSTMEKHSLTHGYQTARSSSRRRFLWPVGWALTSLAAAEDTAL